MINFFSQKTETKRKDEMNWIVLKHNDFSLAHFHSHFTCVSSIRSGNLFWLSNRNWIFLTSFQCKWKCNRSFATKKVRNLLLAVAAARTANFVIVAHFFSLDNWEKCVSVNSVSWFSVGLQFVECTQLIHERIVRFVFVLGWMFGWSTSRCVWSSIRHFRFVRFQRRMLRTIGIHWLHFSI